MNAPAIEHSAAADSHSAGAESPKWRISSLETIGVDVPNRAAASD
jgi:hypothetical protein